MTRRRKRLILAVGIPVAVVVLALVALRLFLPLDKVKEMAVARLSEQLGREVTIAGVGLSLQDGLGIELRDVAVADPPGTGDGFLLTAEGLDLKLETGPLFKREVRVHRLVVRSPRVMLWKRVDGSDNFTFAETPAGGPPPEVSAPAGTAGDAIAVSVAVLEIRDGQLEFRDENAGTESRLVGLGLTASLDDPGQGVYRTTGKLEVDSLLVTAAQPVPPLTAALDFDATYDLGAAALTLHTCEVEVNGFAGTVTGDFVAGDEPRGKGHVQLAPVALADILALLTPEQREPLVDLTLAGDLAVAADLDWDAAREEPLAYQAKAGVTDLVAKHALFTGEFKAAMVHADIAPDLAEVRVIDGTVAGEPMQAAATIRDFEAPRVEASVTGALDLALLASSFPPDLEADPGGRGTFDLKINGRAKEPESFVVTGRVGVEGGRFASPRMPEPITSLDAGLRLEPEALVLELCEVVFPSGDVAVTGRLDRPRGFLPDSEGPVPHLEFQAQAGRFDVDRLFPAAAPAAAFDGSGEPAKPASPTAAAPAPEMPDLTAAGTFAADLLIYSRVDFTNVQGQATYADRQVVCDPASADVYSGRATGRISIDLTDLDVPRYAGTFTANRIEADDFVSRFTKFGGTIFGKTEMSGSFAAAGREPERVKQSLTMDAKVDITEGRVVTAGAMESSLGELAQKAGADLDQEQILKNVTTNIRVKDGRVAMDELLTRLGNFGDLTLDGSYGFAGDMAYQGSVLLTADTTKQLLAQSGALGDLLGSHAPERLNLPLTVGGTIASPKVKVDYGAVTEVLGQAAAEEAGDQLGDWLKKKLGK